MFLACRVRTLYDRVRNLWLSHFIYVVFQFLVNLIPIIFLALQVYCCFFLVQYCQWGASLDANGHVENPQYFQTLLWFCRPSYVIGSRFKSYVLTSLDVAMKWRLEGGPSQQNIFYFHAFFIILPLIFGNYKMGQSHWRFDESFNFINIHQRSKMHAESLKI